jgi:hypothetical protein
MKFKDITPYIGCLLENGAPFDVITDFLEVSQNAESIDQAIDDLQAKSYLKKHPVTAKFWSSVPTNP